MNQSEQLIKEIKREVKRRLLEESTPRIRKCVEKLTDEQIWWRPNKESNSIGNLVLHLSGNVRQWILAGVAGETDTRRRQLEFDEAGPMPREELLNTLETTMQSIGPVIDSLTLSDMLVTKPVQTFEEPVISMIIHVTEHFSYHTGQIAWITKMLTERQLGFYDGVELE